MLFFSLKTMTQREITQTSKHDGNINGRRIVTVVWREDCPIHHITRRLCWRLFTPCNGSVPVTVAWCWNHWTYWRDEQFRGGFTMVYEMGGLNQVCGEAPKASRSETPKAVWSRVIGH